MCTPRIDLFLWPPRGLPDMVGVRIGRGMAGRNQAHDLHTAPIPKTARQRHVTLINAETHGVTCPGIRVLGE